MKPFNIRFIIILALGILAAGCSGRAEANDEDKLAEPAIPVEATLITRGRIANYFSGPVTIEAEFDALVVAKVSGVIKSIRVEEGQRVTTGQVLATLENERESYQLAQAEALLQQAKADFDRNAVLFGKQLISSETHEKSKYIYEGQQAAWRLAKLQRDYTLIKAPFSGIVAERQIKAGNMITANAPAFRIVNFKQLKAVMHVPEIELAKLALGQPATLRLAALRDISFEAEVSLISPVVNASTGTVKVTVEIQNDDWLIKPGMYGRVEILHEIHEDALLLPKGAVLAEDSEANVFVVADSQVFERTVTLGMVNTLNYEILAGLNEGDVVVVTGQSSLKDSAHVIVVDD